MKLYGLEVTRSGHSHNVWTSLFKNKLEEHKKFILEVVDNNDGLTTLKEIESDVVVKDVGWYFLSHDLIVRIDKLTDVDCIGSMFKVKDGKTSHRPSGRSTWYLNVLSNNSACRLHIIKEIV